MTLRFSRLDRASIRRLTGGEKIAAHGITVERLPDGYLRYTVNIMVDGARVHRVIGRERDGVTRTQCEEFIEQARTDARASRLNLPKGRKLALTFGEGADNYVKRLIEGGGKNLTAKRRQLRMYLKPYFGTMRLDGITGFTIEKIQETPARSGRHRGDGQPRACHAVARLQPGRRVALARSPAEPAKEARRERRPDHRPDR
jgi:hypothetical protein